MQILFVGCGNMGGAIVSGMLQSCNFAKDEISAILPLHSPDIYKTEKRFGIKVYDSFPSERNFDAILFAIKPQTFYEILPSYVTALTGVKTLIISIAAGKTTKYLASFFSDQTIVRVMPNINALVGESVSVAYTNKPLTPNQDELIQRIFTSVGTLNFVENENILDAVTAISGSGPAYFFQFVEHLIDAAKKLGLNEKLAQTLAIETFIGSAKLLKNKKVSLAELCAYVTSPGGTTAAALQIFNKNDQLKSLTEAALKAACTRAAELSE